MPIFPCQQLTSLPDSSNVSPAQETPSSWQRPPWVQPPATSPAEPNFTHFPSLPWVIKIYKISYGGNAFSPAAWAGGHKTANRRAVSVPPLMELWLMGAWWPGDSQSWRHRWDTAGTRQGSCNVWLMLVINTLRQSNYSEKAEIDAIILPSSSSKGTRGAQEADQ